MRHQERSNLYNIKEQDIAIAARFPEAAANKMVGKCGYTKQKAFNVDALKKKCRCIKKNDI